MGKETEGGTYIDVHTDSRNTDHVDIYSDDPRGEHTESIHISIKEDGSGTITTKSGDEPRETTDTHCYLTTACMRYFQNSFDDNCYELSVLRWFRDNFVSKDDVEHYYEIAPVIVRGINEDTSNDLIFNYIYDNVVDYCVKEIENGNYTEAYRRYKDSILNFEEIYVRPILEEELVKTLKLVR